MNIETITVPTFNRMVRQYETKKVHGHVFTAPIGNLERQFIIHNEYSRWQLTDCKSGQLITYLAKSKSGSTESTARHALDQLTNDLDDAIIFGFFEFLDLLSNSTH